jgi:hypothetical protein
MVCYRLPLRCRNPEAVAQIQALSVVRNEPYGPLINADACDAEVVGGLARLVRLAVMHLEVNNPPWTKSMRRHGFAVQRA